MPGQAIDTTEKTETGETDPDHSLGIADITAPAIMTCTEATPDCNKRMATATIGAVQGNLIQHTEATATEPVMTHHTDHTADHTHNAAHQVTAPGTTVDCIHAHHTDQ